MDAELLREIMPFGVGVMFVSPILVFVIRREWTESLKWAVTCLASVLIGASISFITGELAGELPEAITAIIIDTSLVYTGSQLAYWLVWRAIGERGEEKANDKVSVNK